MKTWTTAMALTALLGAPVACFPVEGAPDNTSPLETWLATQEIGLEGTFSVGDAYPDDVDRLVIVCPYAIDTQIQETLGFEWAGAWRLANRMAFEDEQAILGLRGDEVVIQEIMKRRPFDLCGDLDVTYPYSMDPDKELGIRTVNWADGSVTPGADLG